MRSSRSLLEGQLYAVNLTADAGDFMRTLEKLRLHAIAVTAHAREEDRAKALSVGFAAHLAKPFEPERLLEVAASAMGAVREQ